jgi:hypothetical protein
MFRIPLIALLICCSISLTYAQDSVKKVSPAKVPVKYKTYKTNPATVKAAPIATVPMAQQVQPKAPVKRDSVPVVADRSLSGQYQFLLTKVYRYQQPFIATLWKNVSDSLNVNKHKLRDATGKLSSQNKTIDSLKGETKAKDQSLAEANARVDSVSLAGLYVSKATYNIVMWGLVLVFGITAAIVIARSGSHSREAKYRVKLYNELEEEFKTYKTKANEKEKKLARELQTERNKLDELLGRG